MATSVDEVLDEARRAFLEIVRRIALTADEKQSIRDAAPKLGERAIELVAGHPKAADLRPMVIAWALAQLLGPYDVLEQMCEQ